MYMKYSEYVDNWPELAGRFSREAVANGSLDRLASDRRVARGTLRVDTAFLRDIEQWRADLATSVARHNGTLSARTLNYVVQQTIDRIVFLRMCEDRNIEPYGHLASLAVDAGVYPRLIEAFRAADARYNSGLFQFSAERGRTEHPDTVSLGLAIPDDVLQRIIERLYFPASPYEFSVLPSEILGQVYERFLGKVIVLNERHEASVEEKPAVRKAGGVYYTPSHVVDYIIHHVLHPALEGRSPDGRGGAHRLKVVDPACGSGSFLLAVYQYLLDWHRDWYLSHQEERYSDRVYQASEGEWRLTIGERKRILLNNIFGVDIDGQAVETTKLSLLLKVLEHESAETVGQNLRLFHERALPDLGKNIKSGNSLVGPDFYRGVQIPLSEDDELRINVFDWKTEFADIFERREGGFDAIVGNPPYVFGEYLDQTTKSYMEDTYSLADNQFDTYALFVERSLQLTGSRGTVSMVVPDALLARDLAAPCRELLLSYGLERIYHCGIVFEAGVSAAVFVADNWRSHDAVVGEVPDLTGVRLRNRCRTERFVKDPGRRFLIHASDEEWDVLQSMEAGNDKFRDFVRMSRGEELGKAAVLPAGKHPILVGEDVTPYHVAAPSRYVERYLKSATLYTATKIVVVKTGSGCIAAVDTAGHVTMQSLYNLKSLRDGIDEAALVGILNSSLVRFFIHKTFTAYKLLFPQLNQTTIEAIPIPGDLLTRQSRVATASRAVSALAARLQSSTEPQDKEALLRRIAAAKTAVDDAVFELYGLDAGAAAVVRQGLLKGKRPDSETPRLPVA